MHVRVPDIASTEDFSEHDNVFGGFWPTISTRGRSVRESNPIVSPGEITLQLLVGHALQYFVYWGTKLCTNLDCDTG